MLTFWNKRRASEGIPEGMIWLIRKRPNEVLYILSRNYPETDIEAVVLSDENVWSAVLSTRDQRLIARAIEVRDRLLNSKSSHKYRDLQIVTEDQKHSLWKLFGRAYKRIKQNDDHNWSVARNLAMELITFEIFQRARELEHKGGDYAVAYHPEVRHDADPSLKEMGAYAETSYMVSPNWVVDRPAALEIIRKA
jgi:hypothetical protein